MRQISILFLLLVVASIVAVSAAAVWVSWPQAEGGKYVTLRGELLALSIQGGPTIYYLRAGDAESLIRLELENIGAFDVGPYIGKQIEVTGYLYEDESRQQWMDVRVLGPVPAS